MSPLPKGKIVEIELDDPRGRPIDVAAGELVYVVMRRAGRVVARRVVEGPGTLPARLDVAVAAWETEPMPAASPGAGEISVVVATRDRAEDLARCLAALRALHPAPGEIVVADSASRDAAGVRRTAEEGGARAIRCEMPGLSLARNTGAAAARGAYLAFLDDDCRIERSWLDGVRRGFEDPGVHAVTGGFLPSELDHDAQIRFLRYAHMDRRGFTPRRFTAERRESRHWPLDAWRMGSGGNLAARADAFHAQGGFRLDLGLGTPSSGGEDLFFLWSVVRSGGDVVYRPDAMAWHRHHRDPESLARVMAGYGSGHAAYLAAARRAGAPAGAARLYALSVAYDRMKRAASQALRLDGPGLAMTIREGAGMIGGGRA